MFSKLYAWLTLEGKTVETILAGYYRAVSDLEAHAAAKVSASIKHQNAAAVSEFKALEASSEAQKAADIATKLKGIIS